MDKPVYLDWAATAPLCKEAADAMAPYLQAGIDGLVAGNGNAIPSTRLAVRRFAHSNRRAKI